MKNQYIDEKKFGRIKKVRTFALANEVRDTP